MRTIFLTGAALVALAAPAAAQTGTTEADDQTILVTAQKRSEDIQDVPLAITAVSGETLQALNVNGFQQLAVIDPSLLFKQSTSASTSGFFVRGIGTTSFSNGIEQSVSTVVDGVVLGDPQSLQTLADIARVEVARGPQGLLFGKNASAGVVSIITNAPKLDSFEGNIRATLAEHGESVLTGVVNLPLAEKAALRLVATRQARDAYITDVTTGQGVNAHDIWGARARLLIEPNDKLTINFAGDYNSTDKFCCSATWRVTTPNSIAALNNARFGIVASPENFQQAISRLPEGRASAWGASLTVDYDLGAHALTAISAWRESERRNVYDADLTVADYVDFNGGENKVKTITHEIRIASPSGQALEYVAGLYYWDSNNNGTIFQQGLLQTISAPFVLGPRGPVRSGIRTAIVDNKSYAAFGQATLKLSEKLDVIAGLRLNRDDVRLSYYDFRALLPGSIPLAGVQTLAPQSIKDTSVSWKVGPRYNINDDVMVFATVSRGYKGPGFSGLSISPTQLDQSVFPEIPTAYEAGVKAVLFDRALTFNANIFRNDIDDFQAQVLDPNTATSSSRITNAGKLQTQGFELNTTLAPTRGLSLSANATYLDAEYKDFKNLTCYFGQATTTVADTPGLCFRTATKATTNGAGNKLANAPEFTYGLVGNYETEMGGFSVFLNANWRWQSKVTFAPNADPGTVHPSYGVLGASAGLGAPDGRWRVTVYGTNLMNEHWAANILPSPASVLSPSGYIQYLAPDSIRRVGVTLDVSF